MTEVAKHTRGPWTLLKAGSRGSPSIRFVAAGLSEDDTDLAPDSHLLNGGMFIAQVIGPDRDANAEFIVRACNAHDDLLAALIEAREELKAYEQDSTGETYNNITINAAIKRATEG